MTKVWSGWTIIPALLALAVLLPAGPVSAAASMAELQKQAQQMAEREARIWRDREAEQRAEQQKQEKLATDTVARRARAEGRSNALGAEFDQNDKRITEMRELLHQYQGNLGSSSASPARSPGTRRPSSASR